MDSVDEVAMASEVVVGASVVVLATEDVAP